MKKIYVCSPCKGIDGDYEKNAEYTRKCAKKVFEQSEIPIVPHMYLPKVMNDSDPAERKLALEMGIELLLLCEAMYVFCGRGISDGMKGEIKKAEDIGIPIYYFDIA